MIKDASLDETVQVLKSFGKACLSAADLRKKKAKPESEEVASVPID